jgi:hypothetical protein
MALCCMLLRADGERPTLSTNASVITSSYAANFSSVSPFFSPMEGAMARPVVGRTVVCFRVAQFIVPVYGNGMERWVVM